MFDPLGGARLRPVAVRSRYSPPTWRPQMAQSSPFVEVKPNVNINPNVAVSAPINLELGGLPLSIGLFAGAGLAFIVRGGVPEGWPKTVAMFTGVGLAVGGIVNLIVSKKAAAPGPAAPAPGAPPPPPSAAPVAPGGGASAISYTPATEDVFANITGRISQPEDFSTVSVHHWSNSYPVRVQLYNPSANSPASFELELSSDESPSPVGSEGSASQTVHVDLNPGETKDVDVNMPLATWGWLVVYIDVGLTAKKRRAPGEDAQLLDQRSFVVR